MRICILGDFSGNHDEGMKNVAFQLAKGLSKDYKVLTLNIKDIFKINFWKKLNAFNPQIFHYTQGPTIFSLIILKIMSLRFSDSKTVISAIHTHPHLFSFLRILIPLFKPDLVLVQSHETEKLFVDSGCKTKFLPNGINLEKFRPISIDTKKNLRMKYGIDLQKFVILHVGTIKKGRNIQVLKDLQKGDYQVLIVGTTTIPVEKDVQHDLEKSGCLIWIKYFQNINEIYALSDCYVFPVPPTNRLDCIELSLSDIEAMACNLPVISTKFGGLTRIFDEGDGLILIDNDSDIYKALKIIQSGTIQIKTREKVLAYSWENIIEELKSAYSSLADGWKSYV